MNPLYDFIMFEGPISLYLWFLKYLGKSWRVNSFGFFGVLVLKTDDRFVFYELSDKSSLSNCNFLLVDIISGWFL